MAVVAVNLVMHPALVFIVDAFGRSPLVVLPCEATVICVEAFLFMLAYGFVRWRLLMAMSSLILPTLRSKYEEQRGLERPYRRDRRVDDAWRTLCNDMKVKFLIARIVWNWYNDGESWRRLVNKQRRL